MSWFHRHNRCFGLVLFRVGRYQAELFYCPHGEEIEPHIHQKVDSTLVILGGGMDGRIGERHGIVGWQDFLRRFHVPAGTVHSAKITGWFCLFLNFERWTGTPTSAAIDFKSQ